MHKQRPVYLNLLAIQFPLPAIVSILHRLSGALLFLIIPFLLWVLQYSLFSSEQFSNIALILGSLLFKLIIWIFLVALGYHLFAGIRHLIMDLGIGESLKAARFSSGIIIALTLLWAIKAGVWLWFIV